MNCPKCGAAVAPNEKFCMNCGSELAQSVPVQPVAPVSYAQPAQPAYKAPVQPAAPVASAYTAPAQPSVYAPAPKYLSPWAYIGYSFLFSIPIVGFILLIIFSLDSENINRRNYARSFFCGFLIAIVIMIITAILMAVLGVNLSDAAYRYF